MPTLLCLLLCFVLTGISACGYIGEQKVKQAEIRKQTDEAFEQVFNSLGDLSGDLDLDNSVSPGIRQKVQNMDKLKNYDEVVSVLTQALSAKSNSPANPKAKANQVYLYSSLSRCQTYKGDYAGAEPNFKSAISIMQDMNPKPLHSLSACLQSYAFMLKKAGRTEDAAKAEGKAEVYMENAK